MTDRLRTPDNHAAAYFAAHVAALYQLAEKIGGRRLAERFENVFNQAATDRRLPCMIRTLDNGVISLKMKAFVLNILLSLSPISSDGFGTEQGLRLLSQEMA